jgi:hypothetical protein
MSDKKPPIITVKLTKGQREALAPLFALLTLRNSKRQTSAIAAQVFYDGMRVTLINEAAGDVINKHCGITQRTYRCSAGT